VLAAEAASLLKLKNSNDNGVVVDSSLLDFARIWMGAIDSNSPNVGTSDNDDDG
jgi:hypothetical protein